MVQLPDNSHPYLLINHHLGINATAAGSAAERPAAPITSTSLLLPLYRLPPELAGDVPAASADAATRLGHPLLSLLLPSLLRRLSLLSRPPLLLLLLLLRTSSSLIRSSSTCN